MWTERMGLSYIYHSEERWPDSLDLPKTMSEFCSVAMLDRLHQEPDLENKLMRNAIALLQRIKEFMEKSDETDWDFFELFTAINNMMTCTQKQGETNITFRRRLSKRCTPFVRRLRGIIIVPMQLKRRSTRLGIGICFKPVC